MKNLDKLIVTLGKIFNGKVEQLVLIILVLMAAMLIWQGADPAVILPSLVLLYFTYLLHRILDYFELRTGGLPRSDACPRCSETL